MKRFLLLSGLAVLIQFGYSQIPDGYYDSATGSGFTLKTQLHNIIKDHTELSYTPGLWDAYYTTDVDIYYENDGSVLDIYSENPTGADPYNFVLGDDQDDGSNVSEGVHYNREHSFPRNWFGGEVAPMNTDIFHIYPTDKVVNNERSNWPYGEVDSPIWTSANGTQKGSCSYPGYTGTVFEPIDEFKGDIARTYFYMATCYEDVISSWPGSDMLDGSSDQCFTEWALNMLIEWHNNDPVSQKEIDRNNEIYNNYQYNRNPFIDHPEYVAQIWGGSGVFISEVEHIPANPTSTDVVTVTATITSSGGTITSTELKWGISSGTYPNTVTMSSSKGTYSGDIPAAADGSTIYYMIEASDDNAESATSSEYDYTIDDNPPSLLLNEDFSTCPATGWITYSDAGSEDWSCGTEYMQINAFNSDVACDDWLISPPVNLDSYEDEILTFQSWTKFSDTYYPPVDLKYSTDYAGSGDPSSATWTDLSATFASEDSETWTNSGDIDISAINGSEVYFAFRYTSSDAGAGTSALWQIDDVILTGNESTNVAPEISEISISPESPIEGEEVTVTATITDADGTIATAEIQWGTSAGSYTNTVSMTGSGDDYSGIIPSQSGGVTVYYIVEATDDDSGSIRSSERSFSFNTAGNTIPEITNIAFTPEVPESNEEVEITATIIDSDGTIDIAQIKWGTATSSYLNTINLTKGSGNDYSASIPAQDEGTEIYFIIYAVDEDGGSAQSAEQNFTVNFAPVIGNVNFAPAIPESSESVNVSAEIIDSDGSVDTAFVKWGTLPGNYTDSIGMDHSDNSYTGNIPAQDDKTTVYFIVKAKDDNGGLAESTEQTYTVDDPNVLPEITNIVMDPINPESTDDVRISADISDTDGSVEDAILKWGTTAGNYTNNVTMSASEDSYSGTIPAQADGTEVFFVITAEDDEGGITTSSEQSYTVEDPVNEAPVISDITYEPTNPTPADNVVVSCIADDIDGSVTSVLLKWKVGSSSYTDVSMNASGGKYYGQIPQQTSGTTVDFTIIAEDNEGLQVTYDDSYLVSEANGLIDITEENIRVYPNPAKEFITVQVDHYNQPLEFIIYDVIGSQVYRKQVDFNNQHKINMEDLESGLYFISFVIDKTLVTKKIILKK